MLIRALTRSTVGCAIATCLRPDQGHFRRPLFRRPLRPPRRLFRTLQIRTSSSSSPSRVLRRRCRRRCRPRCRLHRRRRRCQKPPDGTKRTRAVTRSTVGFARNQLRAPPQLQRQPLRLRQPQRRPTTSAFRMRPTLRQSSWFRRGANRKRRPAGMARTRASIRSTVGCAIDRSPVVTQVAVVEGASRLITIGNRMMTDRCRTGSRCACRPFEKAIRHSCAVRRSPCAIRHHLSFSLQ